MSRRKSPDSGPEIYHRTLYPRVPSDGWGRFMHATTARRLARELWQIREGAKKALTAETRAAWPVLHLCVLVEHPHLCDPEDDVQHDLLYEVLCLACTWLTSASSGQSAIDRARAHAIERALAPDEAVNAVGVSFRVWQPGDGWPCVIESGEGRHHAHAIRDLDARGDFAECASCGWRAGPYRLPWEADIAAKNHNWINGGSESRAANPFTARDAPCPVPLPAPLRYGPSEHSDERRLQVQSDGVPARGRPSRPQERDDGRPDSTLPGRVVMQGPCQPSMRPQRSEVTLRKSMGPVRT